VKRHLQDFCQVKSVTGCALCDLLAATEAISDDQPVRRSLADGWEQFEFANHHGHLVFVGLEAKGASHAAATCSRAVEVNAQPPQDGLFGGHLH